MHETKNNTKIYEGHKEVSDQLRYSVRHTRRLLTALWGIITFKYWMGPGRRVKIAEDELSVIKASIPKICIEKVLRKDAGEVMMKLKDLSPEAIEIIKLNIILPTKYADNSVVEMVNEQEELIKKFKHLGFDRESFFRISRELAGFYETRKL